MLANSMNELSHRTGVMASASGAVQPAAAVTAAAYNGGKDRATPKRWWDNKWFLPVLVTLAAFASRFYRLSEPGEWQSYVVHGGTVPVG